LREHVKAMIALGPAKLEPICEIGKNGKSLQAKIDWLIGDCRTSAFGSQAILI
jgi:hypothetical protein